MSIGTEVAVVLLLSLLLEHHAPRLRGGGRVGQHDDVIGPAQARRHAEFRRDRIGPFGLQGPVLDRAQEDGGLTSRYWSRDR